MFVDPSNMDEKARQYREFTRGDILAKMRNGVKMVAAAMVGAVMEVVTMVVPMAQVHEACATVAFGSP